MMTYVTGPPDSGKSKTAEDTAAGFGGGRLYYIATMKIMDDAGRERIRRHRMMRNGKGFTTLEIETDIPAATDQMDDPENAVVLLECVANLVGNMMHDLPKMSELCRSGPDGEKEFAHTVADSVVRLSEAVLQLVVVSTEYEPSPKDDEDTKLYKKLLKMVNKILEDKADAVRR